MCLPSLRIKQGNLNGGQTSLNQSGGPMGHPLPPGTELIAGSSSLSQGEAKLSDIHLIQGQGLTNSGQREGGGVSEDNYGSLSGVLGKENCSKRE